MILDAVFASDRELAKAWQREASERRGRAATDPVADTLDSCARELLDRTEELQETSTWVSAEEYAQLHGCTPQTVRGWIRREELAAHSTASGYVINRHATRKRSA